MSKEIHATGDPNAGPLSPSATKTRGQSMREAAGTATTNGMSVGSQVSVVIPPIQRGIDRTTEQAAPANADGVQKDGTL